MWSIERAKGLCPWQPKWPDRLRTWLPALINQGMFRDLEVFALFIGYPRSGHSLVGSLLNAHPNMLIGHELNVLHFARRGFSRAQLLWMLWQQDRLFEQIGRHWTGYDYRVPDQWQGRFERLRVIGDKHGNGASTALGHWPHLLGQFERKIGVPVKLVHVVRHPLDNLATMQRKQQQPLEEIVPLYLSLCETNQRILRERPQDAITIHLEDLTADPQSVLSRLCKFLGLPACPHYLADCASIVFDEPRKTRDAIEWPSALLERLDECCRAIPFLNRYATSMQSGSRRAA